MGTHALIHFKDGSTCWVTIFYWFDGHPGFAGLHLANFLKEWSGTTKADLNDYFGRLIGRFVAEGNLTGAPFIMREPGAPQYNIEFTYHVVYHRDRDHTVTVEVEVDETSTFELEPPVPQGPLTPDEFQTYCLRHFEWLNGKPYEGKHTGIMSEHRMIELAFQTL